MLKNLFTEHPGSMGESYLTHCRVAIGFALQFLVAGIACLIHAVLPIVFVRTGSRRLARLNQLMSQHARKQLETDHS